MSTLIWTFAALYAVAAAVTYVLRTDSDPGSEAARSAAGAKVERADVDL
jgi:hypothetical protein